jgi:hypothetical protein
VFASSSEFTQNAVYFLNSFFLIMTFFPLSKHIFSQFHGASQCCKVQATSSRNSILSTIFVVGLYTVFFVSYSLHAQAPKTQGAALPQDVTMLVDSGLHRMGMDRTDLWMPWDAYPDDRHRLPIIKQMFSEPLESFAFLDRFGKAVESPFRTMYLTIGKEIGLAGYTSPSRALVFGADEIDEILGVRLDTAFSLEEATIIRQFLNGVLAADRKIRNYTESIDSATFTMITSQADSMLLGSESAQNASLYELKKGEQEGMRTAKEFFFAAEVEHFTPMYQQAGWLYEFLHQVPAISSSVQSVYAKNITTTIIETPKGKVALGGMGDDVYHGDFLFIFDIGGNDRYIIPQRTKDSAIAHPVRAIIDVAGDDAYISEDYGLGSGCFGVGILMDFAGDDHYTGGNFSLGSGLFGVGILEDKSGNDTYTGKTCTQGSGAFGIGLLLDSAGNDVYTAQLQGQGFGFTRGIGMIADKSGNDSYIASSPFQDFLRYDAHYVTFTQGAGYGYRPVASGGIGLIIDNNGNDSYVSDIYGQATAYWYAFGGILDNNGDDRYQSYQYAQGSGVHLAHAALYDKAGNDHYYSHGVSQGCGHDIAFGGLIDLEGDDEYVAQSLSQGGGNADAISLLVDRSGNDAYIARTESNMMGFSDWRREYGMIGLLVDGNGDDLYGDSMRNNSIKTKSTYGAFADFSLIEEKKEKSNEPLLTPPDNQKEPLRTTIDSLFIQASAAPQKFQYNVNPARERIASMELAALPFLARKLSTESARERHALDNILGRLCDISDAMRDSVASMLIDSLASTDEKVLSRCTYTLGKKQVVGATTAVLSLADNPSWRVRTMAARTLGKLHVEDKKAKKRKNKMNMEVVSTLTTLVQDPHPDVRMRAAHALGRLNPKDLADSIAGKILAQPEQLVLNSFVQGLVRHHTPFRAKFIRTLFKQASKSDTDVKGKQALAPLCAFIKEWKSDRGIFLELLKKQDPAVRDAVYRAIESRGSRYWRRQMKRFARSEKDKELKAFLKSIRQGD